MQHINDFFSFRFFISPYVLFFFYYLGALTAPLGSWFFAQWLKNKYRLMTDVFKVNSDESKIKVKSQKHQKNKSIWFILFFILILSFLEIMWRVMFEFLIAYFQMREALLELAV
ncbi:MAG: DUF4282 domain-containing protein [Pseudomonadota bacterium]